MLALFQSIFAQPRHTILLIIAAWAGISLAEKRAEQNDLTKDDLNNIIFYSLIAFIIGGRVSFVLQHFSNFAESPLGMFSISPDVFETTGALAAAAITGFIFGQRRSMPLWNTLDALTPFFGMIVIGLGFYHLAAKTAFGVPTELPWGIELWSATRHPTQIYAILASSLTMILLWRSKQNPRPGQIFLKFTTWTAAWNIFILGFRADANFILNGVRQEQISAWLILALSFWIMEVRGFNSKKQIKKTP